MKGKTKFTKVKFDEIIDIKLDHGFYSETEYEEIEERTRTCFPFKKKDVFAFIKELSKINPKII